MIELQRCTDQEVWDGYILESGGHPLQLWGWGQVKSAHGWNADRLLAYNENDQIVAAAQILTRKLPLPLKAYSYVPRGPVGEQGSNPEFLEAIGRFVKRERKSVTLAIEPDTETFTIPDTWRKTANRVLPAQTIILNLELSDSDLLAAMVKKTRQYIRKSAGSGLVIKSVKTRDELEKCLAIYHATSKRAKFDVHKDQYYIDVFSLLGEHSPVFAAYKDGEPIAFLWLAISADTSFELYGGMNDLGQELRANYALKWHAIRTVKEWGLSRYDFGGLINDGVSNFKRSWSDREVELAGTFELPLSSSYGIWNKGLPTAKSVVRTLRSLRSLRK